MSSAFVYRDLGRSFSEWFDWVLSEAEIYDYGRYPAKGVGVWMPYGFKLRGNVVNLIRSLLDATGHEEILLPVLIPENILAKESEHVKGFEDQVYWVTHGGLEPLDVKLALRPTSETSLTYMESFWIKSYKQLPKKYYQVVSIFRYETKATRAMLRVREVTTFKEAHTVHEDFIDSERQVLEAVNIYSRFFDELGLPYLISKRPEWDKFAGALYTIAFDTLMPDGRALQIGTVHNLGQNFTKAFEVKVQKRDETIDYAWQTSYGVSERVIASLLSVHGDSDGAVLPFHIAPIQVVVVPIPSQDAEVKRAVVENALSIAEVLKRHGLRVHADLDEDKVPAEKFRYWELRGVPIRVDLGPKEIAENLATVVRRDTKAKVKIRVKDLPQEILKLGNELTENLRRRAWGAFKQRMRMAKTLKDVGEFMDSGVCVVEVPWCGDRRCCDVISERFGVEALGTPLEKVPLRNYDVCPVCGRKAATFMRYTKKY